MSEPELDDQPISFLVYGETLRLVKNRQRKTRQTFSELIHEATDYFAELPRESQQALWESLWRRWPRLHRDEDDWSTLMNAMLLAYLGGYVEIELQNLPEEFYQGIEDWAKRMGYDTDALHENRSDPCRLWLPRLQHRRFEAEARRQGRPLQALLIECATRQHRRPRLPRKPKVRRI